MQGYEYNGTIAPPYTTFYGLYDHYHSYSPDEVDWDLPERWVPPPDALDGELTRTLTEICAHIGR